MRTKVNVSGDDEESEGCSCRSRGGSERVRGTAQRAELGMLTAYSGTSGAGWG